MSLRQALSLTTLPSLLSSVWSPDRYLVTWLSPDGHLTFTRYLSFLTYLLYKTKWLSFLQMQRWSTNTSRLWHSLLRSLVTLPEWNYSPHSLPCATWRSLRINEMKDENKRKSYYLYINDNVKNKIKVIIRRDEISRRWTIADYNTKMLEK